MELVKYLKSAFVNHWNLLAFLGAGGFSVLSPSPDVFLPLVLAAETLYVGLLASHPKFQKYVDAQEAQANRRQTSEAHETTLQNILRTLPAESLSRFNSLRTRCQSLRQIAMEMKSPSMSADMPLDEFQVAGLDRLLWISLRLLYTQYTLARFLKQTDRQQIELAIQQLDAQLKKRSPDASDAASHRMRKAISDNLQTNRDRLANWQKAQENYQLVELEIDRLENKIRSLSEMAVNRQEPDFISGQVDQVASSMVETERTMNELRFATGLESLDQTAPQLLEGKAMNVQKR